MSREIYRDSLAVINGPEDGNLYPISQPPCYIGSDGESSVLIRLDRTVQPEHVMLTPVNGGYRVRCINGSPAYVDGKRVGKLRSQILRPGSELHVGHTTLLLKCATDGLANRYTGVDLQGDFSWALRMLASALRTGIETLFGLMSSLLLGLLRNWKLAVPALLIIGYIFVPPIHNLILWGIYYIRVFLARLGLPV